MADKALFWDNWKKTKLAAHRRLSVQEVEEYYDYFAEVHYELNPEMQRLLSIAAADRMQALQAELNHRRTRDLQVRLGIFAAVVLIAVGFFQHSNTPPPTKERSNAKIEPATTASASIAPSPTTPSNPAAISSKAQASQSPRSISPAP